MSKAASRGSVRRMTGLSLLAAIIAVLTILGNFVRFGPFPITLALAPIIIGAAMYGPSAGAILGGVFGLVTLLSGIAGWDGGTVIYLPVLCARWSTPAFSLSVCLSSSHPHWRAGQAGRAFSTT